MCNEKKKKDEFGRVVLDFDLGCCVIAVDLFNYIDG